MTEPQGHEPASNQPTTSAKWAPWWIYLIVLLGANYARSAVLPGDSLPLPAIVAIAVGQAAVLFVIITAIWRVTRRDKNRGQPS
ncbi:hypothetical protein KM427_00195 [Nocardioides sp. LMS-CY]|uniref:hypothetical protein n=1 Tax=Nocardioides sp. (strain LMS-CY) TaxID=2840457 RepID=UPI001C003EBA|nr:hypothetical protein [Nocardioides sp. LMS-CY]QWF22210.1 hypothetical protein KM427_00195 [Nocardioides sp. LMS-CY]